MAAISQPRRFIPLEIAIVSAEDHALQAFGVPKHKFGNALALYTQELRQSVHRFNHHSVNQGSAFVISA